MGVGDWEWVDIKFYDTGRGNSVDAQKERMADGSGSDKRIAEISEDTFGGDI